MTQRPSDTEPRSPAPGAGALYAFSLLSGVAALGYQVAWTKQLSLTFGATTLAASAVIAGFMGGMGVGAWLYHRLLGRASSPLRLYGGIEIGIAVSALGLTLLLPRLPALLATLPEPLLGSAGLVAFRFVVAFALLLIPAALMGATFPALSVALIRSASGVPRHLGMLYGLNTVGAALGALLAGLVLVQHLGLRGTVLVGNGLNLLVGLAALWLAGRAPKAAADAGPPPVPEPTEVPSRLPTGVAGIVLFGSGLATLAYEIVWFRALTYIFGNSTYAFTAMLFIFLTGLGLGSLAFRPVAARADLERALGFSQLGIGAFALLAMGAVAWIVASPELVGEVSVFFPEALGRAWWHRLLVHVGLALVVMLPATLLMGLSFPIASSLLLGDVGRLGRRLGGAVLISNLGSIAGALLGALFVLPGLGTVGGTRLVAALNLGLGVLVFAALPGPVVRRVVPAVAGVAAALALAFLLPPRIAFVGSGLPGYEITFEEEGDLATIQLWQHQEHAERMGVAIDGVAIGATPGFPGDIYSKQILLAHYPLVLDPRVRRVLTVGLGSGSTLEALAMYPQLERVDAVEINAPVVRAAKRMPSARVFDDPRVSLTVDDAIHFLARAPEPYDLIVADGKQARAFSGNAKMLSREFYQLARDHLAEDGRFVQWISVAVGSDELPIVLHTIAGVFPYLDVYYSPHAHLILVASSSPLEGRPRLSAEEFAASPAAEGLASLGVAGMDSLLATRVAGREALLGAAGPGPENHWDHLVLEFTAYRMRSLGDRRAGAQNMRMLEHASDAEGSRTGGPLERAMRLLREAYRMVYQGDYRGAAEQARRAEAIAPTDPGVRRWAGFFRQVERKSGPGALAPLSVRPGVPRIPQQARPQQPR
jgi:spermidine synthase